MTQPVSPPGQMVALGEIAAFRNGVNFIASQRGPGIPILNVKDFQDRFHPNYFGLEELKPDAIRPEAIIEAGDTLFVRSNGNKELIGRSMHVRTPPRRPTTHSAFTIRMRITSTEADPLYCAYYLRGGPIRQTLSAQGSGTNISNLNQDILSRLQIWLPPLHIQRRIAGILSAYDDLIEVNKRRIILLEEMARRLFEEWFVRFRFPGRSAISLKANEQSPPREWPHSSFSTIVEVMSGGTPRKAEASFWDGSIPFFTPTDAKQRVFATDTSDHITEAGLSRCASQLYKPWTVFITARGTVGRVLMAGAPMAMNQSCYALRGKSGYPQTFVYGLACQAASAFQQMAHGAVFDTIIKDTFDRYKMHLPPVSLAHNYDTVVRPMYETILIHLMQIQTLRTARDLLLPKLISGEIDVSGAKRDLKTTAERTAAE